MKKQNKKVSKKPKETKTITHLKDKVVISHKVEHPKGFKDKEVDAVKKLLGWKNGQMFILALERGGGFASTVDGPSDKLGYALNLLQGECRDSFLEGFLASIMGPEPKKGKKNVKKAPKKK